MSKKDKSIYSDWQILRIRRALQAFRTHHRVHDDDGWRDSFWNDVADAIYEYTGLEIAFERIRQFVEGVPGKDGKTHFPVPQPERLAAFAEFLTHEDINLLSQNELDEYVPSFQAPLRLLEYLDEQPGAERILPPAELKGIYQTRFVDADCIVIRELALLKPSKNDGMLEVAEIDEFYERDGAFPDVEDTFYGLEAKLDRRIFSKGWAVITPEDNILFFLKDQENGRNRYYFSLALGEQLWSEGVLEELVLYDHSFPELLPGPQRPRSVTLRKVKQGMEPRLLHYKRVSDEVGGDKFRELINS